MVAEGQRQFPGRKVTLLRQPLFRSLQISEREREILRARVQTGRHRTSWLRWSAKASCPGQEGLTARLRTGQLDASFPKGLALRSPNVSGAIETVCTMPRSRPPRGELNGSGRNTRWSLPPDRQESCELARAAPAARMLSKSKRLQYPGQHSHSHGSWELDKSQIHCCWSEPAGKRDGTLRMISK